MANSVFLYPGFFSFDGTTVTFPSGSSLSAGRYLGGDGTAALPTFSFTSTGSGDNGLFLSAANALGLSTAGVERWTINASGHLVAFVDNTYDIGASGATRPRNIFASNKMLAGSFGPNSGSAFVGATTAGPGTITLLDAVETGAAALAFGPVASATSRREVTKKVTGLADAVATAVVTVTVPNANHAGGIKLKFVSSNGSTDAFESTRVAEGFIAIARTSGVATVAVAATLEMAAIATVAAGATHTLAYTVSAMTGLVSATQTFTIDVTINDSGNVGSNQVVVVAEIINGEATGITIA